jgi:hypothetical protein
MSRSTLVLSISTRHFRYDKDMAFPIKTCVACGEEFELRPGKPGFANRCPSCSEPETEAESVSQTSSDYADHKADQEVNAARRRAIRDLLYRKDS